MMKFLVALIAALGLMAAPAAALDQQVAGTVVGSLALSAETPAAFTDFQPGQTTTSAGGTVTVLSTSPAWTLSAAETGGDGHLSQTGGTCSGSTSTLANPLGVALGPTTSGVTFTPISLSGSDQAVAHATAQPLPVTAFTTTFSQHVNNGETLAAGCIYGATVTYTLVAN